MMNFTGRRFLKTRLRIHFRKEMYLEIALRGMVIGIDARMYGPKVGGGGLGRYLEQLITQLQEIEKQNRFVLFLKPNNFDDCQITNPLFSKIKIDIHWYTLREQWALGKIIDDYHLDLVHFPHWNVPWKIKTPFIVTIHDLILLDDPRSAKTPPRPPLIHFIKYQGYKKVLARAIKRARHIIAVSEFTRQTVQKHFPTTAPEKISVIHEGVTQFLSARPTPEPKKNPAPYFLYVGNAYPHKNLEFLISTFAMFKKTHPTSRLIIAGHEDVFFKKTKTLGVAEFISDPTDADLQNLYSNAQIFIFPSRLEGFGLPPLEAMRADVPVVASNRGSLPEILGDAAVYFNPQSSEELLTAMETISTDENLRQNMIRKGQTQVAKFSFRKMAEETMKIYAR